MSDEPEIDGFFLVRERDDGLYVTVFPPSGGGRGVSPGDIRLRLKDFGLENVSGETLSGLAGKADGIPRKVGQLSKTEYQTDSDATGDTSVQIAEDGMAAYLTYIPKPGMTVAEGASVIKEALERRGVTSGIDRGMIHRIAESGRVVRNVRIADGAQPEPGTDGEIEFFFKTQPARLPQSLPGGRVDHREVNLVQNVKEGQVLLRITPGTPGQPGLNVQGKIVHSEEGSSADQVVAGAGVKENRDRTEFIAKQSGHATLRDGVLSVTPLYYVDGDVAYESGNVIMNGSVCVTGTVRSGFMVQAEEDVEIFGAIEAATVISKKGSIWVNGGIVGGGKAKVAANIDVVANFIERSTVAAGRDIIVDDYIRESEVSARREVVAVRGRGQLMGGISRAERKIRCKILGSPAAPFTEARIEPIEAPKFYRRLTELDQAMEALEMERVRLETFLKRIPQDTAGGEVALSEIQKCLEDVEARKRIHAGEEVDLERRLSATSQGEIAADEKIYENVLIAIGRSALRIKSERGPLRFYREGEMLRWK